MLAWTVMIWILTPTLTKLFGYYGFPLAHLAISLTFFVVVLVAKRNIPFQFFRPIKNLIISVIPMVLVLLFVNYLAITSLILSIVTSVLSSTLIYFIFIRYIFNINPVKEIKYLFDIK